MSRVKKSKKKATVERKVQMTSIVVKMNQPWEEDGKQISVRRTGGLTYHEVKTEFVIEFVGTGGHELSLNVKATGRENDGK